MSKDKPAGKKASATAQFKFSVGDEVMGKWPGSDLWYEATIVSFTFDGKKCVLKYTDGQENVVSLASVSNRKRFRPRSRSASPSRKSSPGRRGRRSRSKSPSRKKSSPRKPSPSQAKRVRSQQLEVLEKAEDQEEKPPVTQETVTVTTRTKVTKTPPRTAVGQQLVARVTRSALRQLEEHGVDTEKIRQQLGKGLHEEDVPSSKDRGYEFGGPFGTLFMMFALPLVAITSYVYCNKNKCWYLSEIFKKHHIALPTAREFLDPKAAAIVYGWIAFQVFLSLLPLGKVVEGVTLKDSRKLKYRLNGFFSLVISLVAFAACLYYKLPVVNLIYDKFLAMMTHAIILSFALSKILYLKAWFEGAGFSEHGNTGNFIYDFFMGKQLNPQISNFDLKFFFELGPGLIGWVIIDLVMAVKLYETSNVANSGMILVCLFHFIYVADALWFEESMLTTPDITKEGFGFMLVFGDLVWVPFMFSLQARFLVINPVSLPTWLLVLILVLNGIGYIIYRVANLQKHLFRQNQDHPVVEHLESMSTGVVGKRLLVSGWWGYVRHPNYLGDIIMAVSWSLSCGFSHAIPYFYPVFLAVLLIHRACRDEADNRQKYGHSWDEYCKRVPYRIFPNIF